MKMFNIFITKTIDKEEENGKEEKQEVKEEDVVEEEENGERSEMCTMKFKRYEAPVYLRKIIVFHFSIFCV